MTNNATKVVAARAAGEQAGRQRARRALSAKRKRSSTRSPRASRHEASSTPSAGNDDDLSTTMDNVEYLHDTANAHALAEQFDTEELTRSANQPPSALREPDAGVKPGSDKEASFLSMYFREMAALDVLRPEEEFTQARKIEELEIAVWEQLLSYPPIIDHVIKVVETCMDNSLKEFGSIRRASTDARKASTKATQDRLTKVARQCAEKLRTIDTDKLYLEAVMTELGRIERGSPVRAVSSRLTFSTKSRVFGLYLGRVRGADRAAASARNDFVKANLRLVVSIARRFNHGRMALADLIQEGNIGLMKAVERYDYRRGFRFSTYASWWIRHAISRALADKGREVRLPVHMIDAHHRLSKAKRELTTKFGRQPSNEELAEATQMPADKIERMRTYLTDQSFSLDRPVNDEDGRSFVDFLHDPSSDDDSMTEKLSLKRLAGEVRCAMRELKPIEAEILKQRFGLGDDNDLTLKEIGEKYNLSRERIRQLQEQALSKVRRSLERKEIM
jgi:RNA polymerase primary sigma factor